MMIPNCFSGNNNSCSKPPTSMGLRMFSFDYRSPAEFHEAFAWDFTWVHCGFTGFSLRLALFLPCLASVRLAPIFCAIWSEDMDLSTQKTMASPEWNCPQVMKKINTQTGFGCDAYLLFRYVWIYSQGAWTVGHCKICSKLTKNLIPSGNFT